MHRIIPTTVAAFIAMTFACLPTLAFTDPEAAVRQIPLTETQIQGFIAAQKDMSVAVEKMQGATSADKPTTAYEAELERVTKKHGFKDFAEYEAVAANISMVMATIDPQTKEFTDPQTAIKKEIDDLAADKAIPENEKRQLLEELKEALKAAEPIQFPINIELVKKYYDRIDAALG
jgi:septal ring factor EnvC (AmiA/AmiB activator)